MDLLIDLLDLPLNLLMDLLLDLMDQLGLLLELSNLLQSC